MIIHTPISLGELIDKISILKIKQKNIKEKKKLILINEELILLESILADLIEDKKIEDRMNELLKINSKLWKIEDELRDCEREKKFDKKFIDLARAVYFTNDIRSRIKLSINKDFGSKIIEVKSYEKY